MIFDFWLEYRFNAVIPKMDGIVPHPLRKSKKIQKIGWGCRIYRLLLCRG